MDTSPGWQLAEIAKPTNHEVGNPQTVLDGGLDGFIDAELKRRRSLRG